MFKFISKLFSKKPEYEYGVICTGAKARRNTKTGKVEFVLWKAGQEGHTEDYYHRVGEGVEKTFVEVEVI